MKLLAQRLRHEAWDLLEFVLVPGLAAVLPWRFCFRLFRRLARFDVLYRHECHEALRHAQQRGWVGDDPARWLQICRLVTLVDHADFWLSRFRSDRWMQRHLLVQGEWPAASEGAVLCTFHWGAGMWALRHVGSQHLPAHALVAPHERANFRGRSVRFHYFGARNRENARALGTEMIEVGALPRKLLETLKGGQQLMAAVDVPSDQAAASESIHLLGLHARVPRGLFRIAAKSGMPVYVYLTGLRVEDGMRTLHIHRLGVSDDPGQLMRAAFVLLETAIRNEPAAWHFWKVAPRFFVEER
jgi:hypothetical protein